MTPGEFNKLVKDRMQYCNEIMGLKRVEYSGGGDRLQNFKEVGAMNQETASSALWGMVSKQIVGVKDMARPKGGLPVDITESYLAEKIGDVLIYLYLLEATLRDEGRVVEDSVPGVYRQDGLMRMLGLQYPDSPKQNMFVQVEEPSIPSMYIDKHPIP